MVRLMRSVQGWAWAAGAITVALGVAHDAVLSTQLDGVASLTQDNQDGIAWLFLCTGTAVAFAGALCIVTARGMARGEPGARRVTLAACIFLALLGMGGVVLHQMGALSLIALAVLSFVPWWRTRRAADSGGVR